MNAIRWSMQTGNAKIGWGLFLQWVLVSILGFGVGAAIGNAVANAIPPMTCTQSFSDSLMERLTNLACGQPSLGLVVPWARRWIHAMASSPSPHRGGWLVDTCYLTGLPNRFGHSRGCNAPGWRFCCSFYPAGSRIRSSERDNAMARPESADCTGRMVTACPSAWLTGGWRHGHCCIPCYGFDWIL